MLQTVIILAYVAWFSTLAPITVMVLKWKYLGTAYKAVLLILVALFSADTISFVTNKVLGQNMISVHANMFLETMPVFLFFFIIVKQPRFQKRLKYAFALYLLLHVIDMSLTAGLWQYNWLSRAYVSVVFVSCSMYFIIRMRYAPSEFRMNKQPLFWFCVAIAILAGGVFSLDIAMKLFEGVEGNYLLNLYLVRLIILISSRLLYFYGILKIPKLRTL